MFVKAIMGRGILTSDMKILGIETSCDETSAAVVEDGKKLLSNVVASSVDLHAAYGGVVPEVAARSHLEYINPVVKAALEDAQTGWDEIDAIAVTQGPGLGGSLLVGTMTARTLALLHNKPLFPVNHVEAHVYGAFITQAPEKYKVPENQPDFPLIALIVSGGHSQIVHFEKHGKYTVLGRTADDAVGEAYDKVAKIIGLPYPGGPSVEKAAQAGNQATYTFPIARMENPYDFSFSGLKTAVLRTAQAEIEEDYSFPSHKIAERLSTKQRHDIAASFQATAVKTLLNKLQKAVTEYKPRSVVVAGGVAANRALRESIETSIETPVYFPDMKLCTDNAAMIASNAYYRQKSGLKPANPYHLDTKPSFPM